VLEQALALLEQQVHGGPGRHTADESSTRPIGEIIDELMADVPGEVLDRLPIDGAAQHDHYVYGLPKRPS
jgi:hypothetical protein